jgi:hypothetical protein
MRRGARRRRAYDAGVGQLRSIEDVEAMLEGLDPEARQRVIEGSRADIRERGRALQLERADLIRRQMALAARLGYPSGYIPDG